MKNHSFITKLATSLMIGMFTLPVFAEDQGEDSQEARSERRNDLTDEQRVERRANHENMRREMREKTRDMTPEERRAFIEAVATTPAGTNIHEDFFSVLLDNALLRD